MSDDFYYVADQGARTFLTITKDGKIVPGEGLSLDESVQATAKMLAEQFSTLHQKQAARIAELEAAFANARREGMEEAAKRLEELHKNHGYDAKTGEVRRRGKLITYPRTIDHAIGYYRAIAEGVAHILATAKEEQ